MIKRIADLIFVLGCFVLTAPLFVVLPLLIKLTSRGPVFYRQERTGLHGRPFTIWKFRSMIVDAERDGAPVWATERDPRVTGLGLVLRRFRLDELPQLLNILRGDMSCVGPRPERPEFVELFQQVIPEYHVRHRVKPGLTGWAQVSFRYAAGVEDAREKARYDLAYVKRRSLVFDCRIMLQTVSVVFGGTGSR